jgi:hypothetical protein
MPSFDEQLFKTMLARACRSAFSEVRSNHKNETFYCMGLFTSGSFRYFVPTAMTEEGLDQVTRKYKNYPQYATEPTDLLRFRLRWSPCDSPLHLEGERHFDEFNTEMMPSVYSALDDIDTEQGWDEFHTFVSHLENLVCEVLTEVDQEGVFGRGEERDKSFISVLMGDQDESIVSIGRRLNPSKSFERFESEWRDRSLYYKSR